MKLWIVGETAEHNYREWSFCGVYDKQRHAIERCTSSFHFIAPIGLNEEVPDEDKTWPGSYYPMAKAE